MAILKTFKAKINIEGSVLPLEIECQAEFPLQAEKIFESKYKIKKWLRKPYLVR